MDDNNKPHYFKYGTTRESVYGQVVFCQYCGHIAFYANATDARVEQQRVAKEPCQRSPKVAVVNG